MTRLAPSDSSRNACSDDRCRVEPLQSKYHHCIHTYTSVQPWSADERWLTYLAFDDPNDGAIVKRDLVSGEEYVLARTRCIDWHDSAGQRWVLNDTAVLYRDRQTDGQYAQMLAHVDKPNQPQKLERLVGYNVRHVLPSTEQVLAFASGGSGRPGDIVLADLRTGAVRELVSESQALDALPEAMRDPDATWFFNHPVSNEAFTRMFFKIQKVVDGETHYVAFCVLNLETNTLQCFGDRLSGHPVWMPDDRHILNIKIPRDGSDNRWLVLVDAETGEDRRLFDQPIEGPGHPSCSPDGRFIITDAFTADGQQAMLYLFDLYTGLSREILRLDHRFLGLAAKHTPGGRYYRGQPHPVWSPSGKQVLINHNHREQGYRLLVLDQFEPA